MKSYSERPASIKTLEASNGLYPAADAGDVEDDDDDDDDSVLFSYLIPHYTVAEHRIHTSQY